MSRSADYGARIAILILVAMACVGGGLASCRPYGRVPVQRADRQPDELATVGGEGVAALRPIPRYGGTVLTAKAMPAERSSAFRWARNVAMFSEVRMEVRAESKHTPPRTFAAHLRDHYDAYAAEFPIFGEVERSARVVAIARWLTKTYPSVAEKIVADAYEPVKVIVPQVIKARYDKTHDTPKGEQGLIGGVVFPNRNRYTLDPEARVSDTTLTNVPEAVMKARPDPHTFAWQVSLGKRPEDRYVAWNVTGREPAGNQDQKASD
ncbi:MAG: hypothetical protein GWP08_15470 [Nitrospiraceae bacterium]|nr:hypothetical protein [Nitrospiraceae bacterium]